LKGFGSFTAAGEALAKPAGQTLARWLVLGQCRDASATVSDIARRLRLARQSVQRIADLLVADGLCFYRDNPHHQRAKLLELTAGGRSALYAIDAAPARLVRHARSHHRRAHAAAHRGHASADH